MQKCPCKRLPHYKYHAFTIYASTNNYVNLSIDSTWNTIFFPWRKPQNIINSLSRKFITTRLTTELRNVKLLMLGRNSLKLTKLLESLVKEWMVLPDKYLKNGKKSASARIRTRISTRYYATHVKWGPRFEPGQREIFSRSSIICLAKPISFFKKYQSYCKSKN